MSPKINTCACTFYEKGGGGGGCEGGRKVESANVASQTKANRGKSVTVTMHEIREFPTAAFTWHEINFGTLYDE